MKHFFFVLISACCITIPQVQAQDLNTIPQTLSYINQKLNLDANKDSFEKDASCEWSVTPDGKLIIKKFRDKKLESETDVYLKQLDTSLVEIYREKGNPEPFGLIKIYSKENTGITTRYLKNEHSDEKISRFYMENVSFNADHVLTNQLKKAIDRLILLAKAKKEYKEKDS